VRTECGTAQRPPDERPENADVHDSSRERDGARHSEQRTLSATHAHARADHCGAGDHPQGATALTAQQVDC
jgi:hypothetical protein